MIRTERWKITSLLPQSAKGTQSNRRTWRRTRKGVRTIKRVLLRRTIRFTTRTRMTERTSHKNRSLQCRQLKSRPVELRLAKRIPRISRLRLKNLLRLCINLEKRLSKSKMMIKRSLRKKMKISRRLSAPKASPSSLISAKTRHPGSSKPAVCPWVTTWKTVKTLTTEAFIRISLTTMVTTRTVGGSKRVQRTSSGMAAARARHTVPKAWSCMNGLQTAMIKVTLSVLSSQVTTIEYVQKPNIMQMVLKVSFYMLFHNIILSLFPI